jgi:dUTP pyrophosphatase
VTGDQANTMITIPIQILDEDLSPPVSPHLGDAGVDLRARHDVRLPPGGGRVAVTTGIAVAIPPGFAGLICSRSGLAAEHGVICLNAPGVIDSSYRGELAVILANLDGGRPFTVRRGDRIAQLLIVPAYTVAWARTDRLPETARSDSGLGASGIA